MEHRQAHGLLLSRLWLTLSLLALGIAGVFAFMVGAVRSDQVQALIPIHNYFAIALTVHVDLSVLVWLLGIMLAWLCYNNQSIALKSMAWVALASVIIITAAAFFNQPVAYLNNYVPVIDSQLFIAGILLFLLAVGISSLVLLWQQRGQKDYALHLLLPTLLALFAWLAVPLLWQQALSPLVPDYYYEVVFWGGGHILQCSFAAIAMLCWLKLATHITLQPLSTRLISALFWINSLCAGLGIIGLFFDPTTSAYRSFYTHHMQSLSGIASGILMLWLLWRLAIERRSTRHAYRPVLVMSLLLYLTGGVLAFFINGPNSTVIPAHYHGAIVGVTMATMGLTYLLLPKLGYSMPQGRMVRWQPYLYAGGQLVHILGLAVSGGYGAVRKTPGTIEHSIGQLAMGVMGVGMLLTILGGALFVVICLRMMCNKHSKKVTE